VKTPDGVSVATPRATYSGGELLRDPVKRSMEVILTPL
jgi:hypothetical protein